MFAVVALAAVARVHASVTSILALAAIAAARAFASSPGAPAGGAPGGVSGAAAGAGAGAGVPCAYDEGADHTPSATAAAIMSTAAVRRIGRSAPARRLISCIFFLLCPSQRPCRRTL